MGSGVYTEHDKPAEEYDFFVDIPILFMMNVPEKEAPSIIKRLLRVQEVTVIAVKAWTPDNVDIHIT